MAAILIILVVLILQEGWGRGLPTQMLAVMRWTIQGSLWVALILTVISGTSFFWTHRAMLREAVSR